MLPRHAWPGLEESRGRPGSVRDQSLFSESTGHKGRDTRPLRKSVLRRSEMDEEGETKPSPRCEGLVPVEADEGSLEMRGFSKQLSRLTV